MKIAMIFPSLDSEKAIANYSSNLSHAMRKQGMNVTDFTYSAGKSVSLIKKLKIVSKYNILHLQHEYNLLGGYGLPFFFVLVFLKFFKKGELIITLHTIHSRKEMFNESFIKTFFRKALYLTQNLVIRWTSDKVIVHANFFKDILVDEYSFSPKKIFILPQGIEKLQLPSKLLSRKELNLSGPVYLIIGNFVPDHGADILLKQAKRIGKTILVVASTKAINDRNPDRVQNWIRLNQDYLAENGLTSFVRFDLYEEGIPRDLWWKYFAASDIVLLPYRGGIGSGIFSDAISAKKPIVASNIPFFKEVAKSFKFIAISKKDSDYPDLIKRMLKKSESREIQNSFEKYHLKYCLSPLVLEYKKIYEKR